MQNLKIIISSSIDTFYRRTHRPCTCLCSSLRNRIYSPKEISIICKDIIFSHTALLMCVIEISIICKDIIFSNTALLICVIEISIICKDIIYSYSALLISVISITLILSPVAEFYLSVCDEPIREANLSARFQPRKSKSESKNRKIKETHKHAHTFEL